MKIKIELPPIYEDAVKAFGPIPPTAVFAYGDTIYNPSGAHIPPEVMCHEEVHERQQSGDPADWWAKYLVDADFRLDQELSAYRAQYEFICSRSKSQDKRLRHLAGYAQALSSPMYGNLLTFDEAVILIQSV